MSSIKQIGISLFLGLVAGGIALVTVSSIHNFALGKLTFSDYLIVGGVGLFGCIGTNLVLRKCLDSAKKRSVENSTQKILTNNLPISNAESFDNAPSLFDESEIDSNSELP